MTTCYSGKDIAPMSTAYIDLTQETPPSLTESDRQLLKSLLEGCLEGASHKNIRQIIREQLRLPSHFTEAEKARIEEIAQSINWSMWAGQFKYWLSSGRWFRTIGASFGL